MSYTAAVFIGRFQPFHLTHLDVVEAGLDIAEKVIIVIGSSNASSSTKNPFSASEREAMIRGCLSDRDNKRVDIVHVRDYFNIENYWIADLQRRVFELVPKTANIALLGNYKDSSSYYLRSFPQWTFIPVNSQAQLHATDVRQTIFESFAIDATQCDDVIRFAQLYDDVNANAFDMLNAALPGPVLSWLSKNFLFTKKHIALCNEFSDIERFRSQWLTASLPVTFVTACCVVVQSGHILLTKRLISPGKGQLALPFGYLSETESLEETAIRELREQTMIRAASSVVQSHIKESRAFDYPNRSQQGRFIMHAFYVKLPKGDLFEISDPSKLTASWLPLMDVGKRENEFFEDHFSIINWFTGR